MSKSLEELQREYEENTVKLEQEKRKLRRLENRKSYLDSGSRKQRSHRLITRGAAIESVMPEVKIPTKRLSPKMCSDRCRSRLPADADGKRTAQRRFFQGW